METTIQVNFNRPLPLFALHSVVMLPHSVQQLHIFEPHYRQMIDHVLDRNGQIAVARLQSDERAAPKNGLADKEDLYPAVCVAQIMQHHRFEDGRYLLLALGICRAGIVSVDLPDVDDPDYPERMYPLATCGLLEDVDASQDDLSAVRGRLEDLLKRPSLNTLRGLDRVAELAARDEVPTAALIEVIGSTLIDDPDKRYELLSQPDVRQRAGMIQAELRSIDRTIRSAQWQMSGEQPKGLSWN
ncbi:MAG: LON peptidase substrate-binding domain-containing protein [Phycisphaerales bacterium]